MQFNDELCEGSNTLILALVQTEQTPFTKDVLRIFSALPSQEWPGVHTLHGAVLQLKLTKTNNINILRYKYSLVSRMPWCVSVYVMNLFVIIRQKNLNKINKKTPGYCPSS